MRAIRTTDFLLIENFCPDRWPNGTPNYKEASIPYAWLADTDNGPTKTDISENREKDEAHKQSWARCFGKRPRLELYDTTNDPEQLVNLAGDAEHQTKLLELRSKLTRELITLREGEALPAGGRRSAEEVAEWVPAARGEELDEIMADIVRGDDDVVEVRGSEDFWVLV